MQTDSEPTQERQTDLRPLAREEISLTLLLTGEPRWVRDLLGRQPHPRLTGSDEVKSVVLTPGLN